MSLFVGEGVAWLGFALLCIALFRRWLHIAHRLPSVRKKDRAIVRRLWTNGLAAPYIATLLALVVPLLAAPLPVYLGGLGRLGPWLVAPVTYFAAKRISQHTLERLLPAVLLVASMAAIISATMMLGDAQKHADASRLEATLRLDDAARNQSFVPGTTNHVMQGFYFHRLKMAHGLLVVLAITLSGALLPDERTKKPYAIPFVCNRGDAGTHYPIQTWHWPHRGAFIAFLWALAATYSRAAFFAALVASVVCLGACVRVRWPKGVASVPGALMRLGLVGAICIVALLFINRLPGFLDRLERSRAHEVHNVRAVIWRQAVDIIAAHPAGVGLGQYPQYNAAAFRRSDPLTLSPRTYPHNTLLGLWAEGGPVAALGVMVMWSRLTRQAWRLARKDDARQWLVRHASMTTLFLCIALFVVGLLHDIFFHQITAITIFAVLGILCAQMRVRKSR